MHVGRWNPPALTSAVADALADDARLAEARVRLIDPQVDDSSKLAVVCQLLRQVRLLLLFDDFEQNLAPGGRDYHDPGFAEMVGMLLEAADIGRLLVTSRHPPPDSEAYLQRIDLPPLSRSELGRLLLRLPALRELQPADRQVLVATIGGHPRLIEFVDALLRHGRANLKEVTGRLRRLAGDHGISLTVRRPLTQAVGEAVLLGSRDIFLNELLTVLNPEERELLLQAAVSTLPLTTEDLAMARWGANSTAQQRQAVTAATERLVDLTLISPAGDSEVVVHAWIADALRAHQQDLLDERHRRAADMRMARLEAGRGGFGDLVEIARHRAATRQFDELIGFAQSANAAIARQLGELSVAAFLGQIIPMIPPHVDGYLPLADREMQALLKTGSVAAALDRANRIAATARHKAETDPTNTEAQRDLGISYERLGDLMVAVGNLGEAERFYRDRLTIADRLAKDDPTNAQAQRDLSVSYTKLGDLMVAVGNLGEAERFHRDSLTIRDRLAKDDPTNTEAQRDLSVSYERLGDLMVAVSNLGEAEHFYRDSLTRMKSALGPDDSEIERIREKLQALGR